MRLSLFGVVVGKVRRMVVASSAPVAGYFNMEDWMEEGGLRCEGGRVW